MPAAGLGHLILEVVARAIIPQGAQKRAVIEPVDHLPQIIHGVPAPVLQRLVDGFVFRGVHRLCLNQLLESLGHLLLARVADGGDVEDHIADPGAVAGHHVLALGDALAVLAGRLEVLAALAAAVKFVLGLHFCLA